MKNSNGSIGNRTLDLPVCSRCLTQLRHRCLSSMKPVVNSEWGSIWYVVCTFYMLLVHLICCLLILSWKVKLFHRHFLKPRSKICHWESPVSSLRIQTEWENSSFHNIDEYTLSGNMNTMKKNTVNILVHIEQLGLEWNIGKCKYIFSFLKRIQKNYFLRTLHILMGIFKMHQFIILWTAPPNQNAPKYILKTVSFLGMFSNFWHRLFYLSK